MQGRKRLIQRHHDARSLSEVDHSLGSSQPLKGLETVIAGPCVKGRGVGHVESTAAGANPHKFRACGFKTVPGDDDDPTKLVALRLLQVTVEPNV